MEPQTTDLSKREKKLESGTVEFMNESALAAKHSHYSPQPPQNCCVIGRELFPMQRSWLLAPTHQRGHVGVKRHTPAASLSPSPGPGPCLHPLLTKGPVWKEHRSQRHRLRDCKTLEVISSTWFRGEETEASKNKINESRVHSQSQRQRWDQNSAP